MTPRADPLRPPTVIDKARFLVQSVTGRSSRRDRRLLVFVVPLDSNPYQECLYGPMRARHPESVELRYWRRRPWVGLVQFFPLAAWLAFRGARIAHVHWLAWDIRVDVPARAKLSGALSRCAIRWLGVLGYRLIWTVHNVLPHEAQSDDDLRVVQALAEASAAVIVHSGTIVPLLAEKHISTEHVSVIPQGSYMGRYGPLPDKLEARRSLGISPTGRVVLFFGLIRHYKGVPELLEAWSGTPQESTLVIVGSCPDPRLRADIESAASGRSSIKVLFEFVPDEMIPTYFAACDGVCLPFRATTTSSSALLALSFAKPVIAPRLGALQDLPDGVGYFYRSGDERGLDRALHSFLDEDEASLRHRSDAGLAYAATCSWPAIAEKTFELYREVAVVPPRDRSVGRGDTIR